MREIQLYGALAELVGSERLALEVESPAEAVRALCILYPGARELLRDGRWQVIDAGHELEPYSLRTTRAAGAIEIRPELYAAGGDGTTKLLVGIVLIAAALLTGPFGLGFATAGAILLSAGVGLAFAGLAQAIAPQPRPDYMAAESATDRQSYLFSGSTNLYGPGHPIPLVYGEFRCGGVTISQSIRTVRDDTEPNVLRSTSILEVVDVVSEGVIEGLVSGAQSILLDGVRAEEASGDPNIAGFSYQIRTGAAGEDPIDGKVARTFGVAARATNADGTEAGRTGGAIERTITDPNVSDCVVSIRVPALYTVNGATGGLEPGLTKARLEVNPNGAGWIDASIRGKAGTTIGLAVVATAYSLPELDNVAVIFTEGSFGWNAEPTAGTVGSRLFWRPVGGSTWEQIDTYYGVLSFNTYHNQWLNAATSLFTQTIIEPLLSDQWEVKYEHLGTPPDTVHLFHGATGWQAEINIIGIATTPYEADYLILDLASYGSAPWVLRLSRLEADVADPTTEADEIYFARYVEILRDSYLHAGVAQVQLTADARQLNSRIPLRQYELRGITLELPSNLNPATRVYAGVWDGTFATSRAYYDNPAWILWDLLRSPVYGLGIPEARLDKWSFYAAGVWCDELVEDAVGGTEPRFRFGHQFQVQGDAWAVISQLAGAMQASLWAGQGKVFVAQDRPGDVARVYSAANVIGGEFEYGGLALTAHATVVNVAWRDPAGGYEQVPELVDRPFAIERFGRRESEVLAIGAPSRGQAIRRGRYELLSAEREPGSVKFRVGLADTLVEPGELAVIHDPKRERIAWGGRVVDTPVDNWIVLDRDHGQPAGPATGYTLRVMLSDGTVHESDVSDFGAPVDMSLSLTTSWSPATIIPGAPWVLTYSATRWARIFGIEEVEPGQYEIMAFEHDPAKQADVEDLYNLGASLGFPTAAAVSAPLISSTSSRYEASDDSWWVDVAVAVNDEDAGWMHVRWQIPSGVSFQRLLAADKREATPVTLSQRMGTHAEVGGATVNVLAWQSAPAGETVSTTAGDSTVIPSAPP